jgi:hypothetical protein
MVTERRENPTGWAARRRDIVARAGLFTWEEHTRRMMRLYREVFETSGAGALRRLA